VEIRPIRPTDKSALQDALEHLSPESRRQRFLSAKNRLSSSELRYLTEVDGENHLALVAEQDGEIIGVVRCVRDILRPHRAEVAYVIADEHQGKGLGRRMLLELADLAADHGILIFTASMSADNVAARRLLLTLGEPLSEFTEAGVREMAVGVLPPRTPRPRRDRTGFPHNGEARPRRRRGSSPRRTSDPPRSSPRTRRRPR
jgi:acetyltransferase